MSKCAICQRERPGCTLTIEQDPEDGGNYTVDVCHTCWDVIAQIALDVARSVISRPTPRALDGATVLGDGPVIAHDLYDGWVPPSCPPRK